MRLLTHNMLSSNIKGVKNGLPLRIEAEKMVEKAIEINADFLRKMLEKIDFYGASWAMGYAELPEEVDSSLLESDEMNSCPGSTMPSWNSTSKKARSFVPRPDEDFPSIRVFQICFFMRTRREYLTNLTLVVFGTVWL